ncbi:MAG: DUF2961 domain-containing protein [Proteobacteria bacterium]|nr:DUF2961 domain-containing protein [Pseudomonadota bacterium]
MKTLLQDMIDRDQVARFPDPAFKLIQFSSYDRRSVAPDKPHWLTGARTDRGHVIRTEENSGRTEYVLMDHQAPGAIVRTWATDRRIAPKPYNGPVNAIMRVYIDGNPEPAIVGHMNDVFNGDGLIPAPFAHKSLSSSVSFFPITYAKSCKITVDEKPWFYYFTCREYTQGTRVESYSKERFDALDRETAKVGRTLVAPKVDGPTRNTNWRGKLAGGKETTLELPKGESAVYEITLEPETLDDPRRMRSLILKASFDGNETVWSPVGEFFGTGVGLNPFQGWYRTVTNDGKLICRWVMPYQKNASVSVLNLHDEPVNLSFKVATKRWKWDERSMYFNAGWRYQEAVRGPSDWNYATLKGKGVYVGDTLTIWNPVKGWWGEGDEKIYFDGEDFPSIFGTGTEDYYGYAWGNPNVDFYEHPFHAQVRVGEFNKNHRTAPVDNCYGYSTQTRSRSLDAMPFNTSMKLDMEAMSNRELEYVVGSYWYAMPETTHNFTPNPDAAKRPIRK